MYAILDIESTGGKYNEEGIMEIAIHQQTYRRMQSVNRAILNYPVFLCKQHCMK